MMISIFMILTLILNINYNMYYIMMVSLMFIFMGMIYMLPMNYMSMLSYSWGMDLISWGFNLLLILIIFLMVYSSYNYKYSNKSKEFILMNFFLLLFLFFCFMSSSLFSYYIFFESSLIPTLFLIFGWGYQPERLMAGFYLIFYTLFASLPLLLSIFYLINMQGNSFFWLIDLNLNFYLFLCLITAFLIKIPMFMFHFWLPKAHVEAPISGSMILAGLLLKLGGYGLIRVSLFLYDYMYIYSQYINSLSLFGGLVCGLICCMQLDMKVLVAYSSVCHMALCIMGIFSLTYWGILGSFILMLAHGLCSSGLFCLVNIVYDRSGSRSFLLNKGYMIFMPSLCLFWFILCSNNMGSPLSMNLFGELMLIICLLSWTTTSTFFLMSMSFLACVYSMYLFSFVNHGYISMYGLYLYNCSLREYMLIFTHIVPLNMIGLKFNMFMFMI
uniref:NADH-ubiquinone oxidoreductase chain 4 n=1 Tax=Corythucha marmorata TaxID=621227 RepID=A0A515KYW7_9HEMI|nr:NADH dehydrogenase subunit 4 [Corythucha marmorata]QDM37012.1 NADH dehydrogenase subunit 4 [Corythucha marmorata]